MTTKLTDKNISNVANLGIQWQSVITADGSTTTTGVAGRGYFIDTTSNAHTFNLPASASAGDTVAIKDYAGTFGTNALTINRNGHNIQGAANNSAISTNRANVELVYIDSTKGWLYSNESNVGDLGVATFINATGGTVTTSGNFKIHTFTGDGNFVVASIGNPNGGPNNVDYVVVAGGSGGGQYAYGGGGGAGGGFRESHSPTVGGPYTASPLATPTGLPVTAQTYPVTVGAGGSGKASGTSQSGDAGSNSVFSTITSAGGGASGAGTPASGGNGGSGGGGGGGSSSDIATPAGSGNTPPVSPPQGNNGGTGKGRPSEGERRGGGGGGAGSAGQAATYPSGGSNGGAGVTTGAKTSPATTGTGPGGFSGGSAGSGGTGPYTGNPGGFGAGCATYGNSPSGQANTGGGGGASGANGSQGSSGNGGSGMVVIRYRYQ